MVNNITLKKNFYIIAFISFLIVIAGVSRIIPHLNDRGFWSDELFTAAVIRYHPVFSSQFERKTVLQVDMDDSFLTVKAGEQHPPMYDLTLKLWSTFFGDDELSLRGFNIFIIVIFSTILILGARKLKVEYSYPLVISIATLVTLPITQAYATQARSYIFFMYLSMMVLFAFLKIKSESEAKRAWYFVFYLLATACFLTHYYMAVFIGIIYLVIAWGDIKRGHCLSPLVPIPFVLLWIYLSFHSLLFTASGGVSWKHISYTDSMLSLIYILYGYFGYALLFIVIVGIYFVALNARQEKTILISILVSVVVLAYICKKSGIQHPRHFIFLLPWCLYVLVRSLFHFRLPFGLMFILLIVIVASAPAANSQASIYEQEDYRGAAKYVSELSREQSFEVYASWYPNRAYYQFYMDEKNKKSIEINMISSANDVKNICKTLRLKKSVLFAHHLHKDIIDAFKMCLESYHVEKYNGITLVNSVD